MIYYYDNEQEYILRGIDWDLEACLANNPQDGFTIKDIGRVLAVYEGENDGPDWHWILEMKQGFEPPRIDKRANVAVDNGEFSGREPIILPGNGEVHSGNEPVLSIKHCITYVYLVGGCDYTGWD